MMDPTTISQAQKRADREARYRLSLRFVEELERGRIGLQGRRVALGLAHAICRETDDWHNGSAIQPTAGYRTNCKVLRERLGLKGARGNRDLIKGLTELSEAELIEWADIVSGRQWVDWRFADDAFYGLFDPTPYGLFDIRHVASLVTPLDYLIYNRIGVIRQCDTPSLSLLVEGCAMAVCQKPNWSSLKPSLFAAFVRAARLFDLRMRVICECRGNRIGIDHVTLRISHDTTRWSAANLRKRPLTTRKVFDLDGTGYREQ